jgi:hypothetical protein
MISPTGKGIRGHDKWGGGFFGASRDGGKRKHEGADFISETGQQVVMPLDGTIVRVARPYADDNRYSGCLIRTPEYPEVKMFYFEPLQGLIGKKAKRGCVIGFAQNVAARYPRITNHVHLEVHGQDGKAINPATLLEKTI